MKHCDLLSFCDMRDNVRVCAYSFSWRHPSPLSIEDLGDGMASLAPPPQFNSVTNAR